MGQKFILLHKSYKQYSMKRISNVVIVLCVLTSFLSCEKELETNLAIKPSLCFNCILNPDSLIHGSLSISQSIAESKPITKLNKAIIELTKDKQLIGKMENTSDGVYSFNMKPDFGSLYEITIKAEGFPELHASTVIPEKPSVNNQMANPILNYPNSTYSYYSYQNTISINDRPGTNRYWVYRLVNHPSFGIIFGYGFNDVNSPLIDDFNKVIDAATDPLGFHYEYYLRINDTLMDGQALIFSFKFREKDILFFMDVDEHYDKYLKSSIKQRMNDGDNLLFNEPIQIYSNIENGLGIFGSVAITSFKL